MSYVIGYSPKRIGKISETEETTAHEALETVLGLERSDETIRYIRAPWGGKIGKDELRMRAEQEMKNT